MAPILVNPGPELRWDFVADPPTRFLAELDAARTRLRRRQLESAIHAASRLLRHLEAEVTPGVDAPRPARQAAIRADALAVRALALALLGRPDGDAAIARSLDAYDALGADEGALRPAGDACYGMVLVLADRPAQAVDPLIRAANAGEDVSMDLVLRAAGRLLSSGDVHASVRLLQAVHERYPTEAQLAADLAFACHEAGDDRAAAAAHVAAGSLLADEGSIDDALAHFDSAARAVAGHPLAELGRCQSLVALGRSTEALAGLASLRSTAPALAGARAVTAIALAHEGRLDEAQTMVDDGLRDFPDDLWLLDTRIALLRLTGDDRAAAAAVAEALAIEPLDRRWRGIEAELRLRTGDDPDAGMRTLRELASSLPVSVTAVQRLVNALLVNGDVAEALNVVSRALVERANDPRLLVLEIELLSRIGRPGDVVRHARHAVDHGVSDEEIAAPLAEALLDSGDLERALAMADRAVDASSRSGHARATRGIARQRAHDHDGALDDLAAAVESGSPPHLLGKIAGALIVIGDDRKAAGDLEGAGVAFELAVEANPSSVLARTKLADNLLRRGRAADALRHANVGLELDPSDGWLLGTRGQILEALGEDEEAERALRHAVRLSPQLAWAHAELGDLLRCRKKYREAITELDRAIELNAQDAWPWASRGAAQYALNEYAAAAASLQEAITLAEAYPWAHGVLAAVLCDTDELVDAQHHIARCLELDPSLAWAWSQQGWQHLLAAFDADGNVVGEAAAAAEDAYRRARAREPSGGVDAMYAEAMLVAGHADMAMATFADAADALAAIDRLDADGLNLLGWCRLRTCRHDLAIEATVTARALDPSHIGVAFDLALALLCAGRPDIALDEYTEAMTRVRAVPHRGRRRSLVRAARRDIDSLALDQLRDRADLERFRALLTTEGGH